MASIKNQTVVWETQSGKSVQTEKITNAREKLRDTQNKSPRYNI